MSTPKQKRVDNLRAAGAPEDVAWQAVEANDAADAPRQSKNFFAVASKFEASPAEPLTDLPTRVGAIESLHHVGGSGGRYRCDWCRAEAFGANELREWHQPFTGKSFGSLFPHFSQCPTVTMRKMEAAHATQQAALRDELASKIVLRDGNQVVPWCDVLEVVARLLGAEGETK